MRFLARAGIKKLVLTNAAGSVNPDFEPGSWMMITDHLNLTGTTPLLGESDFVDLTDAYSPDWRERFATAARAMGLPLHEGVYAGMLGPQYETPAEVRMLRLLGADAIGMSTVCETIQARALGLEVAGFSCLTNWAAGLEPAGRSRIVKCWPRAKRVAPCSCACWARRSSAMYQKKRDRSGRSWTCGRPHVRGRWSRFT